MKFSSYRRRCERLQYGLSSLRKLPCMMDSNACLGQDSCTRLPQRRYCLGFLFKNPSRRTFQYPRNILPQRLQPLILCCHEQLAPTSLLIALPPQCPIYPQETPLTRPLSHKLGPSQDPRPSFRPLHLLGFCFTFLSINYILKLDGSKLKMMLC